MSCMISGCNRAVHKRGLCSICHGAALKLVSQNLYTWSDLETLGVAGPDDRATTTHDLFSRALTAALAAKGNST